jgi:hypothetical protein
VSSPDGLLEKSVSPFGVILPAGSYTVVGTLANGSLRASTECHLRFVSATGQVEADETQLASIDRGATFMGGAVTTEPSELVLSCSASAPGVFSFGFARFVVTSVGTITRAFMD